MRWGSNPSLGACFAICLTDSPLAVAGVERVPLRHDWPAWWAKMEAFRPNPTDGLALLCDLDTVLTGPADRLAEPGLAATEDYFGAGRHPAPCRSCIRACSTSTIPAATPTARW